MYAPRKNRAAMQVLATVAVVALIVVAVVVRNGQLTGGGCSDGRRAAYQRHLVDKVTPAMMNAKPTTRFHEPSVLMPGTDPWVM